MEKLLIFYCQEGRKPTDIEEVKDIWWKVPAVTKVLSATQSEDKKAGLAAWRARVGEEAADRKMEKGQERGKLFDKSIFELHTQGTSNIGYIDAYFAGKQIENLQMGFVFIFDEMEIEGKIIPIGYKGFIDFVLDKDVLTDTKTWGKHKIDYVGNKRADWVDFDYYCQICAYAKALNKPKAMILGSDGHSFQEFRLDDISLHYAAFEQRLLTYIKEKKGHYYANI